MTTHSWARRAGALLLSAALTAGLTVAALPVTAAPAVAADATLTFTGHGYGHGRGMGQYGAYGYAVDHGWSYRQILDHFYGGTTLAGDAGNPTVAVQLTRFPTTGDIVLTGPSLAVNGVAAGTGAVLLRRDASRGTFQVLRGADCAGTTGWAAWTTGNASGVAVTSSANPADQANLVRLCEPGSLTTTGYRGAITLVNTGSGQQVVNRVTIDDYLRSVVPSESPAAWGNTERGMHALRAQAVAARSYALSSSGTICDTTSCQVYRGAFQQPGGAGRTSYEQATTTRAVTETSGQVRRSGNGSIARTEFSSSTGGWSAGGTFPAVEDLGDATSSNPNRTWTVGIPTSTVAAKLGVPSVAGIAVTARNGLGPDGGRVRTVVVTAQGGATYSFTGSQVRAALGLKSDWFSVSGVSAGQAQAVVKALYQDLLGRAPDAGGLASWSNALQSGLGQPELVRALTGSEEYVRLRVTQAYQEVLGRAPEASGLQYWRDRIFSGQATVDDVKRRFYDSQEYYNRSGGTPEGYVDLLYQTMFERSASASERSYWSGQIGVVGRSRVVDSIWFSTEAAMWRAGKYYETFLRRTAEWNGRVYWAGILQSSGEGAIREGIAGSTEYRNLAVKNYPS
ncbi:DUF4214 domain-containing protein [Cellulomonas sp. C5510]|uniref:DUF4214 domain-containing protein n=1 Tax=Cellulomonas sp. C5510 TaxID=2871170 RepID=UPI001C93E3D0|nr:DUF4214 domain-containing protein [Cellulomonas sp. C5510]QZN84802.1 DUF4214 domain-containing protein [Cellulomonas sp. C5510]